MRGKNRDERGQRQERSKQEGTENQQSEHTVTRREVLYRSEKRGYGQRRIS